MALRASDLMRTDLVTIAPDATLQELLQLMSREGVGGIPVVASDGSVVGMASTTDLLWHTVAPDEEDEPLRRSQLDGRHVRDIMTPDVFGVPGDATLAELRRFFARTGVHRALVLDERRLVGMVTLGDLLAALV